MPPIPASRPTPDPAVPAPGGSTPVTAPRPVLGGVRSGPDGCPTALSVHAAADGGLARVRIPGGVLTADQARVLARAARDLGDGHIDVTSRGNPQLRALPPGAEVSLGERLADAGLLPSVTHERARNIVASPLTGLDGRSRRDVRPVIPALDAALRAAPALAALSGRFLFALDDGRGDVASLGADLCLAAVSAHEFALLIGGLDFGLRVPAPGTRPDRAGAAEREPAIGDTSAETVAGHVVAAAGAFLAERAAQGSAGWRMSEIDDGAERVAARLGATAAPVVPVWEPPPLPVGEIAGGGRVALSVIIPLGRLSAAQLDLLADVAGEGDGELRLTPWRGVVVPGLPDAHRLPDLAAAGLAVGADSPWHGVTACAGRPGCARSHADVRADATAVTNGPLPPGPDALPVHWVGCERSCGHPAGAHVRVLATPDGYRLTSPETAPGPASGPPAAFTDLGLLAAAVTAARASRHPAQETGE